MAGTPDPIRLTDLADPQFSDEASSIMDAGAELAGHLQLCVEALCRTAVDQLGGLTDFGPGGWEEPLEVLCSAFSDEAGLSGFGIVSVHTQLVQLLKNRLLIAQYLDRHPEALETPVVAPIIIAGLPRTGTTHLHNLLSADPALRSLRYWEAVEPLPAPDDPPGLLSSTTARIERTQAALDMTELWMPEFKRMHEVSATSSHEEIHLLAIDCSTMFFDTLAPIPTWRAHYLATDQTEHYRYMYRVLQVLQHARGGTRWVLKSPQHLEQFGPLRAVFPDASYVVTHRDPGEVTVSMATMIAYTSRMHLEHVDPVAIGDHWTEVLEDLLSSCARDRDLLPAGRTIDVRFEDFMADEAATVSAIYELAGQPLDTRAVAAQKEYVAGHHRNRHGAVIYEPEVLGIDPAACRDSLAGYCERFGV